MNHKPPREVQAGTQKHPITIYVFSEGEHEGAEGWKESTIETKYVPPPAVVCSSSDEPCGHPSCDATYGHEEEEDSACPWHSGCCWYCGESDCIKSHPKCDGSTYKERNRLS